MDIINRDYFLITNTFIATLFSVWLWYNINLSFITGFLLGFSVNICFIWFFTDKFLNNLSSLKYIFDFVQIIKNQYTNINIVKNE